MKKFLCLSLILVSQSISAGSNQLSKPSKVYHADQLKKADQLKQACSEGSLTKVQDLLKQKFNVDGQPIAFTQKNLTAKTALMIASEKANIEIMKALIEAGADVNLMTNNDNERYAWAFDYKPVLAFAIESGSLKAVQLLLDHGADVNALDDGYFSWGIITYAIDVKAPTEIIKLLGEASKNKSKGLN